MHRLPLVTGTLPPKFPRGAFVLAAVLISAISAASVQAQGFIFGTDARGTLGNQEGAYRSGPLQFPYGIGIDSVPTPGTGYVNLKITGNNAFSPINQSEANSATRQIDGLVLLETEQGRLLVYSETQRTGFRFNLGWYQIVDSGGLYTEASGGGVLEIGANGVGFSDDTDPEWLFFFY